MNTKRILALGVFDLFHVGHLRYLQYARAQGEQLTVAVAPDAMVLAVKGKLPIIPEIQRLEIIRGLSGVDAAHLQPASAEDTTATVRWITQWGITLVMPGDGWVGSPRWNRLTPRLAERGIAVRFAPYTTGISTTDLVARIRARGLG